MKPNELMEEWHAGIRINVLAHYECSKLFERYHRLLGYPTVVLSALAGTAFVSSLTIADHRFGGGTYAASQLGPLVSDSSGGNGRIIVPLRGSAPRNTRPPRPSSASCGANWNKASHSSRSAARWTQATWNPSAPNGAN